MPVEEVEEAAGRGEEEDESGEAGDDEVRLQLQEPAGHPQGVVLQAPLAVWGRGGWIRGKKKYL